MRSFTLITALLLYSYDLISVIGSEIQMLEVQPDQDVTLQCSNISRTPTPAEWFRVVNRAKPRCISSLFGNQEDISYCDGLKNGKFEISSNITTVFLKINHVNVSDAGLYFCGFYMDGDTTIVDAVEIRFQGDIESREKIEDHVDCKTQKKSDKVSLLISIILGGLTVFLTAVVIILAVKIRKFQKVANVDVCAERSQNKSSDDLNCAALNFQSKAKRRHRPASERQMESHVAYAATR
ncbi:uncharacterized protein KZ484_020648 isoform 1-T1 [Pholidichthys leucotaenia]